MIPPFMHFLSLSDSNILLNQSFMIRFYILHFFFLQQASLLKIFYKRKILPRFVHEARIKGFTKATKSLIFNLQNTLQIHGKFWYYMLHQHRQIHCAPVEEEKGILHIISMRIRRIPSFKIIRPCLCFTFYLLSNNSIL